MIFTTDATEQEFQRSGFFDEFGDSYFQRADKESLEYSLKNSALKTLENREPKNCTIALRQQIAELEFGYFPANWKSGIFRTVVSYIDK